MSDNIKLIIEIPTDLYEITKAKVDKNMTNAPLSVSIAHEIPLDDFLLVIKKEIKEKCDRIDDIARANIPQYAPHREIQDLLCEILTSIDNAESIVPNDLTHIFDGVTEIPKDAFKGWYTEKMLEQTRAESEE